MEGILSTCPFATWVRDPRGRGGGAAKGVDRERSERRRRSPGRRRVGILKQAVPRGFTSSPRPDGRRGGRALHPLHPVRRAQSAARGGGRGGSELPNAPFRHLLRALAEGAGGNQRVGKLTSTLPAPIAMCREDALEYSEYFPWGIMPFVRGAEPSAEIAASVHRATPEDVRIARSMTPAESISHALGLWEAERARRMAPPL